MEGKRSNQAKGKRVQAGNIHVSIRGNNRNVVFFDDRDRIEFLVRCNRTAKQYDTKIIAFVIMDNHVHLQVVTENLTPFMRSLIHGFSYWYNIKYGLSDKLFRTPFMSYCKFSEKWIVNSILYILNNPVKALMCKRPADHLWSSYHFIFRSKNPLANYIDIDNSIIRNHFKSCNDLDRALLANISSIDEQTYNETEKDIGILFPTRKRISIYDVQNHLNSVLAGRNLFHLEKRELEKIIVLLGKEYGATCRQISSITHENWEYVRRVLKSPPQ